MPTDEDGAARPSFDPAPMAAEVRAALDSYLRERAPDQRLAFWKAIALGYGGVFEDLATDPLPTTAVPSP